MNVYDFDKTIFWPDSSATYVRWCLRRYPRAFSASLPGSAAYAAARALGLVDTRELKQQVFSFLPRLDDAQRTVEEFWEEHFSRIAAWYLRRKRSDDLIVSASPEFLLRPAAERLGVRLIATRMDVHTGRILGKNCRDYEKVTRFLREFPGERIEEFYSDSLSDAPLARLADRAFLVERGSVLKPWPER